MSASTLSKPTDRTVFQNAWVVDDIETANRGRAGDIEFAYYDTRPLMDCMLEVVTPSDRIVERFAMIAAAAENWDGTNPIRS